MCHIFTNVTDFSCCLHPVSYTHLDVYKRQMPDSETEKYWSHQENSLDPCDKQYRHCLLTPIPVRTQPTYLLTSYMPVSYTHPHTGLQWSDNKLFSSCFKCYKLSDCFGRCSFRTVSYTHLDVYKIQCIMDTYIVGKRHEIADRRRVSLADKSSISLLVNNLV